MRTYIHSYTSNTKIFLRMIPHKNHAACTFSGCLSVCLRALYWQPGYDAHLSSLLSATSLMSTTSEAHTDIDKALDVDRLPVDDIKERRVLYTEISQLTSIMSPIPRLIQNHNTHRCVVHSFINLSSLSGSLSVSVCLSALSSCARVYLPAPLGLITDHKAGVPRTSYKVDP